MEILKWIYGRKGKEMDRTKYNKANRLRNDIKELKLLQNTLERENDILCGSVGDPVFCHKITPEMKKTLLKMCIGEIATLEKEFEEL